MRLRFVLGGVMATALLSAGTAAAEGMSATDALSDLMRGNETFQKNEALGKRRTATAQSQSPQAVVLSCSDSRVPPEAVFNRYLGRVFVVRTAGHAIGDYELASIEYAVEHLHTPLVVVMGHERCGAIKATVDSLKPPASGGDDDEDHEKHHRAGSDTQHDDDPRACAGKKGKKKAAHHDEEEIPDEEEDGDAAHDDDAPAHEPPPKAKAKAAKAAKAAKKKAEHAEEEHEEAHDDAPAHAAHDHIGALVGALTPVVKQTLKGKPEDPVDAAVRANSVWVAKRLVDESPVLKEAVQAGKLAIVPARYDLDTGAVELLKE